LNKNATVKQKVTSIGMTQNFDTRSKSNLPMSPEAKGRWTHLSGFRNGPVDMPGYGKTREERS